MPAYRYPDLRNDLKEKIMSGSRGGKAGHWSARKAQLLASEYKKACETEGVRAYKPGPRSIQARHLEKWGEEN